MPGRRGRARRRPAATNAQDVITSSIVVADREALSTEGRLVKEGYDFYVKHINEKGGIKVGDKTYKVAIKYYDDASTAATSVQLYEKLINEDGIKLLLGPYSSGVRLPPQRSPRSTRCRWWPRMLRRPRSSIAASSTSSRR
jgi:hypothetical protein